MARGKLFSKLFGSAVLALLLACGCNGDLAPFDQPGGNSAAPGANKDPYGACTDWKLCCPKEKLKCTGNPDEGNVRCSCPDLWSCDKAQHKCSNDTPVPGGGGNWNCEWTEFGYRCKGGKGQTSPPPGGGQWKCSWSSSEFKWVCTRTTVPNPSNKPGGAGKWNCVVNAELKKLICTKKGTNGGGGNPGGGTTPPPGGSGKWNCYKKGTQTVCDKTDGDKGLPGGGGQWKCHKQGKTWHCYGTPSGNTPPGGGGWTCKKWKVENGKTIYKCTKPDGSGDTPPGGGHFSCVKGSEIKGTRCVKVAQPPTPPTTTPKPGERCVPGKKRWCDGLKYCGWGQMTCKPDGTWPTKIVNGKLVYDCYELADGRRPNTVCGCYHFYYNPACCEKPDCMVPEGTNGQICPKSKGKLCDYCNPLKPECSTAGSKCVVTNSMETFCGRSCSLLNKCPSGYRCLSIRAKGTTTQQCVPTDYSCYY